MGAGCGRVAQAQLRVFESGHALVSQALLLSSDNLLGKRCL